MFDNIVYYSSAILIILFSILSIRLNNIFYSLLSAIVVFFIAGILFFLLGSEYNAVIQIAVYGFAIPITLGVAIMFTSGKKINKNQDLTNKSNQKYITYLLAGVFVLALFYLTLTSLVIIPDSFIIQKTDVITSFNNLNIFANGLFTKYVLAFELMSLILTIVVIGLTIFKRRAK
ncbi:NADH-quinone oxidoreductase subunit J [bacterium]|nr:NADH-quinone oxidoreductase subunit J [bacterium]